MLCFCHNFKFFKKNPRGCSPACRLGADSHCSIFLSLSGEPQFRARLSQKSTALRVCIELLESHRGLLTESK